MFKNSGGATSVSTRTVQRAALSGKAPLKYTKVQKKPLLTCTHASHRLEFASKYRQLNWKRVMFTDSKYYHYIYQPSGRQTAIWCRKGDKPTMPTTRRVQKVHVYAGISYYGVTPLFFVQGTSGGSKDTSVNAAKY